MAAALAHELNQPLTAIANYLRGAQRLLDAPAPDLSRVRDAMGLAAQQTLRAGEIIRRLRAFVARGEVHAPAGTRGQLIEEASALALLGAREHNVHVTLRIAADLPEVQVERVQVAAGAAEPDAQCRRGDGGRRAPRTAVVEASADGRRCGSASPTPARDWRRRWRRNCSSRS